MNSDKNILLKRGGKESVGVIAVRMEDLAIPQGRKTLTS